MESIAKTKIWWVRAEITMMFRLNRYHSDDPKQRISKTKNDTPQVRTFRLKV